MVKRHKQHNSNMADCTGRHEQVTYVKKLALQVPK